MKSGKNVFAAILFLGFVPITMCMYMISYTVINVLDDSSYIRYATNGKYNEDIFFKVARKEIVHLDDMLEEFMKNELVTIEFKRQQDLFQEILKKENSFKNKVLQDPVYRAYLDKNNLTEDDAINYITKISQLDNVMLNASMFIVSLIYIAVYYFAFKYRKRIYLGSGLLYLVLMLDTFSSGLLSNALYPYFKQIFSDVNYEDYTLFIKGMLPAVKEATLTFLMFDAVFQYYVSRKNKRIASELKNTFDSLQEILNIQKDVEKAPNVNLIILKQFPNRSMTLYKFCKRNKQERYLLNVKLVIEQITISEDSQINTRRLLEAYNSIMANLKKSKLFMKTISGFTL